MLQTPHGWLEVVATFGDPRGTNGQVKESWYDVNITSLRLPFDLRYDNAPHGIIVKSSVLFHHSASPYLSAALTTIWNYARKQVKADKNYTTPAGVSGDDATKHWDYLTLQWLQERNLDMLGGTYNYRAIRGATSLSMHSVGIAIDYNPASNTLGSTTTSLPDWFIKAHTDQGFFWGGNFQHRKDPMHFQFATGV